MFYNAVNIESLAKVLPFKESELHNSSYETKVEHLRSIAVPILCKGWTQTFSREHMSIEVSLFPDYNSIKCFGLRLNAKQAAVVNEIL